MNDKMLEIYGTIINNLILQVAQQHTGYSASQVADQEAFRRNLSNTAWNQLPVPLRLMGRDQLRWDSLSYGLAGELFATTPDGRLMVRPDAAQRLDALVMRVMGAPGGYAPPAPMAQMPQAPGIPTIQMGAPPPGPIMAMPVGMQPPPTQPMAQARPAPPPLPGAAPKSGTNMPQVVLTPIPPPAPRPTAPVAAPPRPETPSSRIALGIDLGTTYSVVSYLDQQGRPISIPNAVGDLVTPSIVLFDEAGPIVGKEAMMAAAMEPHKVAVCVKRDMGNKAYRKTINGESLPPEVISSIILKALLNDARRRLGADVSKAVITVPAYFDELRRRATTDAGRLAGLDVLDIINEPTAAALAYGYQLGFLDATGANSNMKPIKILVYDLGGGTFDVTIVEIQGNNFKALATDGDVTLGGKDFDEAIVNLAADKFQAQYGEDPRQSANSLMDLFLAAEVVKKTLSERTKASLYVSHNGRRIKVDITRAEFDELTSPLVSRTKTTTEIVVRQAGLTWDKIDRVLLVGGSSRMPTIPAMLEKLSGKPVDRSVSPDEAVAHGAALYAGLLIKKGIPQSGPPAFSVVNINSHSLGIVGVDPQTGRKKNQILIPKNSPLPRKITKTFKTNKKGQSAVVIRVVEGESERPEACIQVGVCTISNLPPNLPQGTPVQVVYSYEENGQLEVTAQVQGSQAIRTVFKRENNLENDQAAMWAQYLATLEART